MITFHGNGGVRLNVTPGARAALLTIVGDRSVVLDDEQRIALARHLLPAGYSVANEVDLL